MHRNVTKITKDKENDNQKNQFTSNNLTELTTCSLNSSRACDTKAQSLITSTDSNDLSNRNSHMYQSMTSLTSAEDTWKASTLGIKCVSEKPSGHVLLTRRILDLCTTDGKRKIEILYNYSKKYQDKKKLPAKGASIQNCTFCDTISLDFDPDSTLFDMVMEVQIITQAPSPNQKNDYVEYNESENKETEKSVLLNDTGQYSSESDDDEEESMITSVYDVKIRKSNEPEIEHFPDYNNEINFIDSELNKNSIEKNQNSEDFQKIIIKTVIKSEQEDQTGHLSGAKSTDSVNFSDFYNKSSSDLGNQSLNSNLRSLSVSSLCSSMSDGHSLFDRRILSPEKSRMTSSLHSSAGSRASSKRSIYTTVEFYPPGPNYVELFDINNEDEEKLTFFEELDQKLETIQTKALDLAQVTKTPLMQRSKLDLKKQESQSISASPEKLSFLVEQVQDKIVNESRPKLETCSIIDANNNEQKVLIKQSGECDYYYENKLVSNYVNRNDNNLELENYQNKSFKCKGIDSLDLSSIKDLDAENTLDDLSELNSKNQYSNYAIETYRSDDLSAEDLLNYENKLEINLKNASLKIDDMKSKESTMEQGNIQENQLDTTLKNEDSSESLFFNLEEQKPQTQVQNSSSLSDEWNLNYLVNEIIRENENPEPKENAKFVNNLEREQNSQVFNSYETCSSLSCNDSKNIDKIFLKKQENDFAELNSENKIKIVETLGAESKKGLDDTLLKNEISIHENSEEFTFNESDNNKKTETREFFSESESKDLSNLILVLENEVKAVESNEEKSFEFNAEHSESLEPRFECSKLKSLDIELYNLAHNDLIDQFSGLSENEALSPKSEFLNSIESKMTYEKNDFIRPEYLENLKQDQSKNTHSNEVKHESLDKKVSEASEINFENELEIIKNQNSNKLKSINQENKVNINEETNQKEFQQIKKSKISGIKHQNSSDRLINVKQEDSLGKSTASAEYLNYNSPVDKIIGKILDQNDFDSENKTFKIENISNDSEKKGSHILENLNEGTKILAFIETNLEPSIQEIKTEIETDKNSIQDYFDQFESISQIESDIGNFENLENQSSEKFLKKTILNSDNIEKIQDQNSSTEYYSTENLISSDKDTTYKIIEHHDFNMDNNELEIKGSKEFLSKSNFISALEVSTIESLKNTKERGNINFKKELSLDETQKISLNEFINEILIDSQNNSSNESIVTVINTNSISLEEDSSNFLKNIQSNTIINQTKKNEGHFIETKEKNTEEINKEKDIEYLIQLNNREKFEYETFEIEKLRENNFEQKQSFEDKFSKKELKDGNKKEILFTKSITMTKENLIAKDKTNILNIEKFSKDTDYTTSLENEKVKITTKQKWNVNNENENLFSEISDKEKEEGDLIGKNFKIIEPKNIKEKDTELGYKTQSIQEARIENILDFDKFSIKLNKKNSPQRRGEKKSSSKNLSENKNENKEENKMEKKTERLFSYCNPNTLDIKDSEEKDKKEVICKNVFVLKNSDMLLTEKNKTEQVDINLFDTSKYELDLENSSNEPYSKVISVTNDCAYFPSYTLNKEIIKYKAVSDETLEKRKVKNNSDLAVFDLYSQWDKDYSSGYEVAVKENMSKSLNNSSNSKESQKESKDLFELHPPVEYNKLPKKSLFSTFFGTFSQSEKKEIKENSNKQENNTNSISDSEMLLTEKNKTEQVDINLFDTSKYELDLENSSNEPYSKVISVTNDCAYFPSYTLNKEIIKYKAVSDETLEKRKVKNNSDLAVFDLYSQWDKDYSSGYEVAVKENMSKSLNNSSNSKESQKESKDLFELHPPVEYNKLPKKSLFSTFFGTFSQSEKKEIKENSNKQENNTNSISDSEMLLTEKNKTEQVDINLFDTSKYELDLENSSNEPYSKVISVTNDCAYFPSYTLNKEIIKYKAVSDETLEKRKVKNNSDLAVFDLYSQWDKDYSSGYEVAVKENMSKSLNNSSNSKESQKESKDLFELHPPVEYNKLPKKSLFSTFFGTFSQSEKKEIKENSNKQENNTNSISDSEMLLTEKNKTEQVDINLFDTSKYELDLENSSNEPYSKVISVTNDCAYFPSYTLNKEIIKYKAVSDETLEKRKVKNNSDLAVFDLYSQWDKDYSSGYEVAVKENMSKSLNNSSNSKESQKESKDLFELHPPVEYNKLPKKSLFSTFFGTFSQSEKKEIKENSNKQENNTNSISDSDMLVLRNENPFVKQNLVRSHSDINKVKINDNTQFTEFQSNLINEHRINTIMKKFQLSDFSLINQLYQDSFFRSSLSIDQNIIYKNLLESLPSPSDSFSQFLWIDMARFQNLHFSKPYFDEFGIFPENNIEFSKYFLLVNSHKFDFVNSVQRSGVPFFYVHDYHRLLSEFDQSLSFQNIFGFLIISFGALSLLSKTFV